MIYDLKKLDDYVAQGLLRKAEDEDLVQYNYSEYCNNAGLWDDITSFNRGNIYEKKTGKLIARAMPKFMNFGQLPEDKQKWFLSQHKFITTEKKDGCFGILYMYKGEVRCNSRGAFDNYVTDKIKELLPKYLMVKRLLEHNTLNVEVISPATKIICDYGNEEELYLLTAFNFEHKEYDKNAVDLLANVLRMPTPKRNYMCWDNLLKWCKEADFTEEGFVACVEEYNGTAFERVKLKSEDYLRIAKIKANLSKYTIWKLMKNDYEQNTTLLQDYVKDVPDEFSSLVKQYIDELNNELDVLCKEAQTLYEQTKDIEQRDLAKHLGDNVYKSCIFNLRNGKDIRKILIKMIQPEQGINTDDLIGRE